MATVAGAGESHWGGSPTAFRLPPPGGLVRQWVTPAQKTNLRVFSLHHLPELRDGVPSDRLRNRREVAGARVGWSLICDGMFRRSRMDGGA